MNRISIKNPELLHIQDGSKVSFGATQDWYRRWIRRWSGCGPTATSNLLWYLAASRPDCCSVLFDGDARSRKEMLRLMNTVWQYVKPGRHGVDKASILTEGAMRYGRDHGIELITRVLEVPEDNKERPSAEQLLTFLISAFDRNLPVAFLNLSNGEVENLDNWHWVTLVSTDENLMAQMYDDKCCELVDLAKWLKTTTRSGAFVVIDIEDTGEGSKAAVEVSREEQYKA